MKKYDMLIVVMNAIATPMLASGMASLIGDNKARVCVWIGVVFCITVFLSLLLSILKELREINTKLGTGNSSKPPQDEEQNNK